MAEKRIYPVPGYEGYWATKEGEIFSGLIRYGYGDEEGDIHELKGWHNRQGYRMVGLTKDGKTRMIPVHKVQELVFFGGPKPGLQIDHKDGNKDNNNIENLHQVTPYENRHNPVTDKRSAEAMASPEYRARLKGIMQEVFKDEAYRQRVKDAATKRLNDPTWQKNHAKAMEEVWSRPKMRKLIYTNLDKMNNDPEMRAYNAQRSREANSRKCRAYDADGHEIIFNSVTECAEHFGVRPETITRDMRLDLKRNGWKIERLDKAKNKG